MRKGGSRKSGTPDSTLTDLENRGLKSSTYLRRVGSLGGSWGSGLPGWGTCQDGSQEDRRKKIQEVAPRGGSPKYQSSRPE